MQTSIVQPLVGVSGVENGKVSPTSPSTGNRFGDLFSQLMLDESIIDSDPDLDESEPSDTEIPDELPLGAEVKTQIPQAVKTTVKITVNSVLETPGIAKKTAPSEVKSNHSKSPEILAPAEQTLGVSTQSVPADSGWQIGSDMREAQSYSGEVEQKPDKAQGLHPTSTRNKEQNLPQIPAGQHEKPSVSNGFQIPQVPPSDSQNRDIQIQTSQQTFIGQTTEKDSLISVPTKTQITNEPNEIRHTTSGFEQAKKAGLKITDGYTLRYSKSQNPIDGTNTRQVAPPIITVPDIQTLPKDSITAPVTQFTTETTKFDVSSEGIDAFTPAVENTEAKFGQTVTNFALNTLPATTLETSRAGTVRLAGTQMVDALTRLPNQPVEIALSPEELGRVRIVLSHLDAGLIVAISAERPETLDLMRRHIDQLAAEFRQLGYENIGFEFSGGDANSSDHSETENQPLAGQMTDESEPKTLTPVSIQTTGVDIRL